MRFPDPLLALTGDVAYNLKKRGLNILFILIFLSGLTSCGNDSPKEIIRKIEKEYEKEYGSNLIMHRERETYKGMDVYRFTGWTVEDDRKYSEINSDEWLIVFCGNNTHQVIKHTAFRPMDSIAKSRRIKCLTEK